MYVHSATRHGRNAPKWSLRPSQTLSSQQSPSVSSQAQPWALGRPLAGPWQALGRPLAGPRQAHAECLSSFISLPPPKE